MVNPHPKTSLNKIIIQIIDEKNPKRIEELIELIQQQQSPFPLPRDEILQYILNMREQGKLTLKEDSVFTHISFKSYFLSSSSYWYWMVIVLALATTMAVFIIPENLTPFIYVRNILGSIFILFLPGYSMVKLLF